MVGAANRQPVRARRFVLDVPVRFRRAKHAAWNEAHGVNASRTGLLLRTRGRGLLTGERVELRFELPIGRNGATSAVRCTGRVVRILGDLAEDGVLIAVAIEHYSFSRGRRYSAIR